MSFSSGSMGTLTLPSPTHVHHVDVVGSAVRTLRRSMSRSPSKFNLRQAAAQPNQPSRNPDIAPSSNLILSPTLAPSSQADAAKSTTPAHATPLALSSSSTFFSTTPQAPVPTPFRSGVKLSVRSARPRPATNRPLTRIRSSPKSPLKRTFGPAPDSGNSLPATLSGPEPRGQENYAFADLSLAPPNSVLGSRPLLEKRPSRHSMHLDVTGSSKSGVTRFLEMAEPHLTSSVSPLKRSDATMDLDQPNFGSPVAKRRSLHGISSLGGDLGIFGSPVPPAPQSFDVHEDAHYEYQLSGSFLPPMRDPQPSPTPYSMPRRASSLRKTTLQQRHGEGRTSWGRRAGERQLATEAAATPVLRSRPRLSLDQYMPPDERGSPFSQGPLPNPSAHPVSRLQQPAHPTQPHPLSRTLTQSSSNSSVVEESPTPVPAPQFDKARKPLNFSKSLPLSSQRPTNEHSVATPAYQKARPFQAAFMSTGLVSKMDRRPDFGAVKISGGKSITMPDTPCKKPVSMTYPSATYPPQSGSGRRHSRASLGSPSTPFSPRSSRGSNPFSNAAADKALSPFAKRIAAGHVRKPSSISTEADELGDFPGGLEDFPNTPTKSLWKRSSASMPAATQTPDLPRAFHSSFPMSDFERQLEVPDRSCKFVVPPRFQSYNIWQQTDDQPSNGFNHPSVSADGASPCLRLSFRQSRDARASSSAPATSQTVPLSPVVRYDTGLEPIQTDRTLPASPLDRAGLAIKTSPRTPQESFMPPDASRLSISNAHEQHKSSSTQPPATPTMPYGKVFSAFGSSRLSFTPHGAHGPRDVDETLLSRFSQVELIGTGEFSHVFRVTQSSPRPASLQSSLFSATPTRRTPGAPAPEKVFAVKKLTFTSVKERETKLREVAILKALSKSPKVVHYLNSWEEHGHLYIQTEFCAEGSLDNFLKTVGLTGRLDDFRIWKIMLEIAQGLSAIHDAGFIHLDLKPANVLINFDGYLKIGDFGLATTWPAPKEIECEGDREYIGPEILRGQFDKPADLFALGLIILEIACNVFLPENGLTWQALRSGDMSAVPSLTSIDASPVARDANGVPVEHESSVSPLPDLNEFEEALSLRGGGRRAGFPYEFSDRHIARSAGSLFGSHRRGELVNPPEFMANANSPSSLDSIVRWLIQPNPSDRPTASQLLDSDPIHWVMDRRVAGATVYEGNWGPDAPSAGEEGMDTEMMDV